MFGIGGTEFAIIALIAVLLFGAPAIVAFWIGYRAGQRKSATTAPQSPPPTAERTDDVPSAEAVSEHDTTDEES